jgi:uncharacterized protein (DUF1778 family)
MHARNTVKRERLEARVTSEQKALFQRAADLQGRSLTDFVVSALQDAAEDAIRSHHVLTLSAHDSRIFAEALMNPPEPNEYARKAAAEYRAFTGE